MQSKAHAHKVMHLHHDMQAAERRKNRLTVCLEFHERKLTGKVGGIRGKGNQRGRREG